MTRQDPQTVARPGSPAALADLAALIGPLLIGPLVAGCGPSRPVVHPVSGEVWLGDRPFVNADITFVPSNSRPALAQTDAAGRFRLRTWAEGDGAVAGEHVVCIVKHAEASPPPPRQGGPSDPYAEALRKNVAPAKYASPVTSPLRATVTAAGPNVFRFDLDRVP